MIGKASEIKTKHVMDFWKAVEGGRELVDIDEAINDFLASLPPGTEIISIQYQTGTAEQEYDKTDLIIYKGVTK